MKFWSWDTECSDGCGLDVVGLKLAGFLGGVKHISLVLGPTQPSAHLVPGVQQPGDEIDYWYPSSAGVKRIIPVCVFPLGAFIACMGATLPLPIIF